LYIAQRSQFERSELLRWSTIDFYTVIMRKETEDGQTNYKKKLKSRGFFAQAVSPPR